MLKYWLLAYLILLCALVGGMYLLRSNVLAKMGTAEAQRDWNAWRAEAAKEDGSSGPVQRTVPKSPVPPLYLLMHDYFAAALVGLLLPTSALFFFIAWLVTGVMKQSARE